MDIEQEKQRITQELEDLNRRLVPLQQAAKKVSLAILRKQGALDYLNELEGQKDEGSTEG